MAWWFLGCFSGKNSSKKKHHRHRRQSSPPRNCKTEQSYKASLPPVRLPPKEPAPLSAQKVVVETPKHPGTECLPPAAFQQVDLHQKNLLVLPPDRSSVARNVSPSKLKVNEDVNGRKSPSPPPPTTAAGINTLQPGDRIFLPCPKEKQDSEVEKEESRIRVCSDALFPDKILPQELLSCKKDEPIKTDIDKSSSAIEVTRSSSMSARLSAGSCGYYEISGPSLLQSQDNDDDDGCEYNNYTSTSCLKAPDKSAKQATEAQKFDLSITSSCDDESKPTHCPTRVSNNRYQGFEEGGELDIEPDFDDEVSMEFHSVETKEMAENEKMENETMEHETMGNSKTGNEKLAPSPPIPAPAMALRRHRSMPASPVLTPVENLSQWKHLKQSSLKRTGPVEEEGWKETAFELLRQREEMLRRQAKITEEEEEEQENKQSLASHQNTGTNNKKTGIGMAIDASLSHWVNR